MGVQNLYSHNKNISPSENNFFPRFTVIQLVGSDYHLGEIETKSLSLHPHVHELEKQMLIISTT